MTSTNADAIDLRNVDPVGAGQDLPAVLEPGDVLMLVTDSVQGLESRPVTCAEVLPTGIRFLIDQTASWVGPMADGERPVNIAFAHTKKNTYVSLTGTARIVREKPAVDRLWTPVAEAFFDGPDDPKAAVLDVAVTSGEWWSGPSSKVAQVVSLLRAAVTNAPESVGDHGPVT